MCPKAAFNFGTPPREIIITIGKLEWNSQTVGKKVIITVYEPSRRNFRTVPVRTPITVGEPGSTWKTKIKLATGEDSPGERKRRITRLIVERGPIYPSEIVGLESASHALSAELWDPRGRRGASDRARRQCDEYACERNRGGDPVSS